MHHCIFCLSVLEACHRCRHLAGKAHRRGLWRRPGKDSTASSGELAEYRTKLPGHSEQEDRVPTSIAGDKRLRAFPWQTIRPGRRQVAASSGGAREFIVATTSPGLMIRRSNLRPTLSKRCRAWNSAMKSTSLFREQSTLIFVTLAAASRPMHSGTIHPSLGFCRGCQKTRRNICRQGHSRSPAARHA